MDEFIDYCGGLFILSMTALAIVYSVCLIKYCFYGVNNNFPDVTVIRAE